VLFEDKHSSNTFPTYKDLETFLTEKVRKEEMLSSKCRVPNTSKSNNHGAQPFKGKSSSHGFTNVAAIEPPHDSDPLKEDKVTRSRPSTRPTPSPQSKAPSVENSGNSQPTPSAERKSSNETAVSCWNCGGGHVYSHCKEPRGIFCYRCGAKGMMKSNCTECRQGNGKGAKRRGSL